MQLPLLLLLLLQSESGLLKPLPMHMKVMILAARLTQADALNMVSRSMGLHITLREHSSAYGLGGRPNVNLD